MNKNKVIKEIHRRRFYIFILENYKNSIQLFRTIKNKLLIELIAGCNEIINMNNLVINVSLTILNE